MKKIIIKNTCDFDSFGRETIGKSIVREKVRGYFAELGFEVEYIDRIGDSNYIEIIHSGYIARRDKNYLLGIFQRGFGKNVAFIKSEPMFFALVDDYVPAVV